MMTTVALATVCGGGVDYDFLLGSIRHHAPMCKWHVVLDVTPAAQRRRWRGLPWNTIWVFDDAYASGTPMFAFRPALARALAIARSTGAQAVMHLDSDEFLTADAPEKLFPLAENACVEVRRAVWGADGKPRIKEEERPRRLWPARLEVEIPQNKAWIGHVQYDGNPELHPVPLWPAGAKVIPASGVFLHDLHWAFPSKGSHIFSDWPIGGWADWPEPLARWKEKGVLPSEGFA